MRAIVISGGVLGVAAIFGLGVIVGRFVLKDDRQVVAAPTNAIMGPSGLDNPLGDPNAALEGDPSLSSLPQAPSAPLPPATPPGRFSQTNPTDPSAMTARLESDAAIAASAVTAGCNVRVSKNAPVRSMNQQDRITAIAIGSNCATATVRLMLETSEGAALYSLQAPARDFGISQSDTPADVETKIARLLPTDVVRSAAFPAWEANRPAPTTTEFSQEAYEAIRAANGPVTCLKLPTGGQRCVAGDVTSGQIKVLSRS
jgi:hypothetical protein